jgi:hypothetical protein
MDMNKLRTVAALAAATAWLAGCGGGGGSSPPPPPPPPPAPAPIVVTFGLPVVLASGTPAGGAQTDWNNIAITGETGELYVGVRSTHQAVETLHLSGQYLDALQLEVDFRESGTLPDGTYTDTILVDVCQDAQCDQPVAGSPFSVAAQLTVTGSNATIVPTVGNRPSTFLAHDVVDAAMSKPLNAIVMASAQPTNAIWVYDVASDTEKSIALDKAPRSISLSPDGFKVAVGQDSQVSYVDLTDIASAAPTVREVPVDIPVWDLVLDAGDHVQAFPASDQWVDLVSVDVDAGTSQHAGGQLYAKTRARLHPSGDRMYVLDTLLSPQDINRWSIAGGVPTHEGQAPYWGDWSMCGNLWFSEAGDRIYTACGNTFTSSGDLSQDMLHAGSLPVTEGGSYWPNIVWLDDSASATEVAYLDAGHCGGMGGQDCDTLLRVSDDVHDTLRNAWWLPPVVVDGAYRVQHGLFVFHAADGSLRVVGRAVGVSDPTHAYYIDNPVGGTNATLQRAAPRRASSR